MPNSVIDACTVNEFKARLDKFCHHQLVKFDLLLIWLVPETDQKKL